MGAGGSEPMTTARLLGGGWGQAELELDRPGSGEQGTEGLGISGPEWLAISKQDPLLNWAVSQC